MIDIDTCKFEDSTFIQQGKTWSAPYLYKCAEEQKCKTFKLNLDHYDLTYKRFAGCTRVVDIAYHCKRINDSDLSHPILLGPYGALVDGYHRIAKALMIRQKTILAIKLKDWPEPDGVDND